ncbi:MAG: [protein-PII] uridylyltransferase [Cellvibrionaceae bacterium]|nr:[protein-PII] uridylyltransferase [Cellvibrionaceae bacterium]
MTVTPSIPLLKARTIPLSFKQAQFRRDLANSEATADTFKKALEAIDHNLNFRFTQGENIRSLIYERAQLIDCILHFVWHQFHWDDKISLIAVGGYGRGELHPKSDIDILLLLDNMHNNVHQERLEQLLTLLWDIGLNIGHSVRTIDECISMAADDITVATSIMESRSLQGPTALLDALQRATAVDHIWSSPEFFTAKVNEQQQRHAKYNHTEYRLEPNVKNAPGGLRDIQTIQWVAKRFFRVDTLAALQNKNFFTEAEYATLMYGEEFLWKVRYGLHMINGHPEERLLFDHQRELAALFGYQDQDTQLAIEQFMHEYYRVVLSNRALNDVLLQFLDEAIINRDSPAKITAINARFQLHNNFLEVTHDQVFNKTPYALLEIFVLAANRPHIAGIRASTIRLIREHSVLIDDTFRQNSKNTQLFMALLRSPYRLVTQLKSMKRYGILGRYLPEFNHVIGQMQHDLFHIYTVDAHTLNTIKIMRKFFLPEAEQRFPFPAAIARQLPKIELLYIAGLYHDIGKGRGGDHSLIGAEDVAVFGRRHGLTRREIRLTQWLVKNHLLMSFVSQKRDLSNPDVIHDFAKEVGDSLHLNYLFALTVADMNATNPDIWNNWRASLLEQLYREAHRALQRGLENPIDREEQIAETQEAAMRIAKTQNQFEEQAIWELWQTAGDAYFLRELPTDIIWHTNGILSHPHPRQPLVMVSDHSADKDYKLTQIFVRAPSGNNIFAAATNALDQLNLSIQDARIYNTISGYTIDTFYVLDQNHAPLEHNSATIDSIISTIVNELSLSDDGYSDIIKRRTPRQLKYFTAPTRTSMSNDLSTDYSILEVISPDRPGLLARIARIFIEFNVKVINAKISTLGERVEDIFFITDKQGNPLSDAHLCDQLQQAICSQLDAKTTDTEATQ